MTAALRAGIVALAMGLANAACMGLEPAPSPTAVPSGSPIAGGTEIAATATATVTPTATATSTATGTATGTPTPFPGLTIDPITGQPIVPPFGPTGSGGAIATPTLTSPLFPVRGGVVPEAPSSGGGAGGGVPAADTGSPVWGCDGDERMEFLPTAPAVGDKTFIFVTASRNRAFGLILGQGLSGVQGQDVSGGTGLKKRWEFTPAKAGVLSFQFYGGPYPEHLCVTSSLTITGAAPAGSTPTPSSGAAATPTRTVTPFGSPRPDH